MLFVGMWSVPVFLLVAWFASMKKLDHTKHSRLWKLLQNFSWKALDHLPYSQGLEPSNFQLLSTLKEYLLWHCFTRNKLLNVLSSHVWHNVLCMWDGQTCDLLGLGAWVIKGTILIVTYQWLLHCVLSVSSIKILPLSYEFHKHTFWSTFIDYLTYCLL
jgi:hypothetical protein